MESCETYLIMASINSIDSLANEEINRSCSGYGSTMMLRRDTNGQGFLLLLPFVIALIFIIAGVLEIAGNCTGLGIILVGIGLIIGGFGGTLELGYGAAVVGGGGGFVLIVAGAVVRIFVTGC